MIRSHPDQQYPGAGSPTPEHRHSSQPACLLAPCRTSFTFEILHSFGLLPSARVACRIRVPTSSAYTRIAECGAISNSLKLPRGPPPLLALINDHHGRHIVHIPQCRRSLSRGSRPSRSSTALQRISSKLR